MSTTALAHTVRPPTAVHAVMGKLIGISLKSEEDVLRLQQRGLPTKAFERLVEQLPAGVEQVVGSRSSLRRRTTEGVLSETESERALRVARVLAQAIGLFGDYKQARAWMTRPAPFLRGQPEISPLDLCAHEAGAKIIENRLLQTQYGIF